MKTGSTQAGQGVIAARTEGNAEQFQTHDLIIFPGNPTAEELRLGGHVAELRAVALPARSARGARQHARQLLGTRTPGAPPRFWVALREHRNRDARVRRSSLPEVFPGTSPP